MNEEQKYLLEIEKREQVIKQAQKEIEGFRELIRTVRTAPLNGLEQMRVKNLSALLEKPLSQWTSLNRQTAVEVGKFKDWAEAEVWIRKHRESQKESAKFF